MNVSDSIWFTTSQTRGHATGSSNTVNPPTVTHTLSRCVLLSKLGTFTPTSDYQPFSSCESLTEKCSQFRRSRCVKGSSFLPLLAVEPCFTKRLMRLSFVCSFPSRPRSRSLPSTGFHSVAGRNIYVSQNSTFLSTPPRLHPRSRLERRLFTPPSFTILFYFSRSDPLH